MKTKIFVLALLSVFIVMSCVLLNPKKEEDSFNMVSKYENFLEHISLTLFINSRLSEYSNYYIVSDRVYNLILENPKKYDQYLIPLTRNVFVVEQLKFKKFHNLISNANFNQYEWPKVDNDSSRILSISFTNEKGDVDSYFINLLEYHNEFEKIIDQVVVDTEELENIKAFLRKKNAW